MADEPVEQSILVVCAHPDDECIGAGGTIANHTTCGHRVGVLCLTGNEQRNAELRAACRRLGADLVLTSERDDFDISLALVREVADAIIRTRPQIVMTHSQDDYNRAHVETSRVVVEAVEWASHVTQYDDAHRVERVYFMEINSLITHPNVMVDITSSYDTALDALRQHQSQVEKAGGFYPRLYDARTRLRGVQAACDRAEAFTVYLPRHAGPFYHQNSVQTLL